MAKFVYIIVIKGFHEPNCLGVVSFDKRSLKIYKSQGFKDVFFIYFFNNEGHYRVKK